MAVIIGDLVAKDYVVRSGDEAKLETTTKDNAGVVVDITGATIKFGVYSKVDNTEKFTKAVGSGITIINGPLGTFDVVLLAADTAALEGLYNYEAEMILGGKPRTVMVGTINIKKDRVNA